jgi:polysaccharide pyruvyl transferase WcaK-like protein
MKFLKDYFEVEFNKDYRTIKAVLLREPINGYMGWTGYGNLGDEAVFKAYQKLFSGINFTEFRISRPVKFIGALLGRDMPFRSVALGGGTLINQSNLWLAQTQYLLDRKIPMFCLGTGVGAREFWKHHEHIHTADDIKEWANLLKRFLYVGVRGPLSQKRLREAGFDAEITGDSAFALAGTTYRRRNKEKKIVGINVSPGTDGVMWGDSRIFAKEIIGAIHKILADGFEVRLLPIWRDDIGLCKKIYDEIHNPACQIITAYNTIERYLGVVDKCDFFMGLKLHATVFATMLRIPSIMLEYRPKCLDYMESMEMGKYSIRTDQLTASVLYEKLNEQVNEYEKIVSVLDKKVLYYKNLQETKAKYILQHLLK